MILPLRVWLWPHVPGLRFLEFPFVVWAVMIWLSFTSAKGLRWRKTGTEMLLASSILTTSSLSIYSPLLSPEREKNRSRSRIKEGTKYNGKKKEEMGKKREGGGEAESNLCSGLFSETDSERKSPKNQFFLISAFLSTSIYLPWNFKWQSAMNIISLNEHLKIQNGILISNTIIWNYVLWAQ